MSHNFQRKLELFANVAILAVAVLFGYVLIQKEFVKTPLNKKDSFEIAKGTKIDLPGTNFSANGKTLILVLQKGCGYCKESMPFYRTLGEQASGKGVTLVGVLPNEYDESVNYLKENGVVLPEILTADIDSLHVRGTPTLILVNDKGEVLQSWVGKLSSQKEAELIAQL